MQESTGFLSSWKPSHEYFKCYPFALCISIKDCISMYFCKNQPLQWQDISWIAKATSHYLLQRRLRPCRYILYHGRNQGHILKSWNIVQLWFAKRTRDIQTLMLLRLTFFQCFVHIVRNNHSPWLDWIMRASRPITLKLKQNIHHKRKK